MRRLAALASALLAIALLGVLSASQADALVAGGGANPGLVVGGPNPPPTNPPNPSWLLVSLQTGVCLNAPDRFSGGYTFAASCETSDNEQSFVSGWGPNAGSVHIVSDYTGLCLMPGPPSDLYRVVHKSCTSDPVFDWQWIVRDSTSGQWYNPYYQECLSVEPGHDWISVDTCYTGNAYWHRIGG